MQDGALEGSNVSAVETMVSMITAARQFEAQMKMLQTAEGDEKAASQLLSMLPYLATITVLVLISRNANWIKLNMPASLGKPFNPNS